MLTILAFICFAIATVWLAVTRAFPLALIGAGLALLTIDQHGPISIG